MAKRKRTHEQTTIYETLHTNQDRATRNLLKTGDEEEFEGTIGIIRIRKSKDRQYNGQNKKDDLQNIHIALKIE